jgi:hypothetical protein
MPRALCSRFACARVAGYGETGASARPAGGVPAPATNRWRRSPTPRWRGRAAAGSLRGRSLTAKDASLGDLGGDTPSRMARQGGITGYHCGKGHSAAFRSQRRESGSYPRRRHCGINHSSRSPHFEARAHRPMCHRSQFAATIAPPRRCSRFNSAVIKNVLRAPCLAGSRPSGALCQAHCVRRTGSRTVLGAHWLGRTDLRGRSLKDATRAGDVAGDGGLGVMVTDWSLVIPRKFWPAPSPAPARVGFSRQPYDTASPYDTAAQPEAAVERARQGVRYGRSGGGEGTCT